MWHFKWPYRDTSLKAHPFELLGTVGPVLQVHRLNSVFLVPTLSIYVILIFILFNYTKASHKQKVMGSNPKILMK